MNRKRSRLPWSRKELLARTGPKTYSGPALREIALPLGGIGTGSVSLGGWGQLRDWEVMNRPDKGFAPGHGFFTLKVRREAKSPLVKVLQGPAEDSFVGDGHSARRDRGEGLPHFREALFTGSYPFARVELKDPDVPLDVWLEAWSPFIPFEDEPNSIPGIVLTYHFRSRSRARLDCTVYGNARNLVGGDDREGRVNEPRSAGGLTGLFCTNTKHTGIMSAREAGPPRRASDDPLAGSHFLGTTCPEASVWPRWKDGHLWRFWEAIRDRDEFPAEEGASDFGTVGANLVIEKGEAASVTFLITWHFPNFGHYWKRGAFRGSCEGEPPVWKNYYAGLWPDAFAAAQDLARNLSGWEEKTRSFHDALASSSLPAHVLDAVSSNLSILKTNTCLRLPDGTFYGFEGCSDKGGCCEGSCTHVWNYAQAQAFLFPALARSMLGAHFENDLLEDGFMEFRMPLPPATKAAGGYLPAADGQMGVVIQVYREWQLGAGEDWLRRTWPRAKKALEFAWRYWDADRDGVMEGMQHNTYDIEFYGPNSMMTTLYLAALRAAERMARHLGEDGDADEYGRLAELGAAKLDCELFNGEYYEQHVNPDAHEAWPEKYREMAEKRGRDDRFDWPRWQYGRGCISDQVIGCWLARLVGLGEIVDPEHERKALESVFKYNFRPDLTDHVCGWRLYALRDEGGLLVGSWPRGGRPGYPFFYADEIWPGIEYQVASHMICVGLVEEGLAVVRALRDRFTQGRRNPWDEFECGHHYARSLASYALLTALSGFSFSAPEKRISFAPRLHAEDFTTFFSAGTAWGRYSQKWKGAGGALRLDVLGGRLQLLRLGFLPAGAKLRPEGLRVSCAAGGEKVECRIESGGEAGRLNLFFKRPVELAPGESLMAKFGRKIGRR